MSYNIAVINKLAEKGNIIHILEKKQLNYKTPINTQKYRKKIFFYSRKNFQFEDLKKLVKKINPKIVLVCGWVDFLYLFLIVFIKIKKLKTKNVLILDSPWRNSIKQKLLSFFCLFGFFRIFFDKIWIPGSMQFEYARRLGFKTKDVIFDLNTADTFFFQNLHNKFNIIKKKKYPKVFLFIGRKEKIKGLENLLIAWKEFSKENLNWKLKIIGSGSLKLNIDGLKNIELNEFKSHEDLANDIKKAGCFVLPSIHEPWGVVVHEMCSAGLPLLLSEKCGARYTFLINNINGYVFDPRDPVSLKNSMIKIAKTNKKNLIKMSEYSNFLSKRISADSSANNLLSIIN